MMVKEKKPYLSEMKKEMFHVEKRREAFLFFLKLFYFDVFFITKARCAHAHTHTYIYTHIHAHIHAHIHTHAHTWGFCSNG